jgi:hypothetical protein
MEFEPDFRYFRGGSRGSSLRSSAFRRQKSRMQSFQTKPLQPWGIDVFFGERRGSTESQYYVVSNRSFYE